MHEPQHLRTFETRDSDVTTEYQATALNIATNGDYIVADLGMDTVRVFTSQGRNKVELDTEPLEEPTSALPVRLHPHSLAIGSLSEKHRQRMTSQNHLDCVLVASRTGLKLFSSSGELVSNMTSDVKCPQSVATDPLGNIIISDMLDGGSVIVTLEAQTLIPIRIFCGSHAEVDPGLELDLHTSQLRFSSAWYVCVTRDYRLVVSDRSDHMIKAYTLDGEHLWSTGGFGAKHGEFVLPAGLAEDDLGHILVADSGNDRVQLLSSGGEWLGVLLGDADVVCPMDLAVGESGELVVLQGSGTVSVYTYMNRSCEQRL